MKSFTPLLALALLQACLATPLNLDFVANKITAGGNLSKKIADLVDGAVHTGTSIAVDGTAKATNTAGTAIEDGTTFGKNTVNKGVSLGKQALGVVDSAGDLVGLKIPVKLATGMGGMALDASGALTNAGLSGGNYAGQTALSGTNKLVNTVTSAIDGTSSAVNAGIKGSIDLSTGAMKGGLKGVQNAFGLLRPTTTTTTTTQAPTTTTQAPTTAAPSGGLMDSLMKWSWNKSS